MRVKMKRTMAVFPPVCGKKDDRSVGGDMSMRWTCVFRPFRSYTYVEWWKQKSVWV
jgi:hypothetical protein